MIRAHSSAAALCLLIAACLLAGCAGSPTSLDPSQRIPVAARDRVAQQLVVTIADSGDAALNAPGSSPRPYAASGLYDGSRHAQRLAARLAREYGMERVAAWHIGSLDLHCIVYEAVTPRERDVLLRRLEADPRIESVQAMTRFETHATGRSAADPMSDLQTFLADMEIPAAHAVSLGRRVRVAIIDTGVDLAHAELAGRISRTWNLVDDDQAAFAADRHGTAIAGVVAAAENNGIGIVGVAPAADLIVLKACWEVAQGRPGACNTLTLAAALDVALAHDVRIVNLSLSGPEDPLLRRLVEEALSSGIVVVGPHAPSASGAPGFPAAIPGVIAVAEAGQPVADAGRPVVPAPGEQVLALVPGQRFDFVSGVSYSTAMVSGVIALLLERTRLPPAEVMDLLLETATLTRAPRPARTVNACRALARLGEPAECSGSLAAARPR